MERMKLFNKHRFDGQKQRLEKNLIKLIAQPNRFVVVSCGCTVLYLNLKGMRDL